MWSYGLQMDPNTVTLVLGLCAIGVTLLQIVHLPKWVRLLAGLASLGCFAGALGVYLKVRGITFSRPVVEIPRPPRTAVFVPFSVIVSFGIGITAEWRKDVALSAQLQSLALRINQFNLETAAKMPILDPAAQVRSIAFISQHQNRRRSQYLLQFREELLKVFGELYGRDLVPKDWHVVALGGNDLSSHARYLINLSELVIQAKDWPRRALIPITLYLGSSSIFWFAWIALSRWMEKA